MLRGRRSMALCMSRGTCIDRKGLVFFAGGVEGGLSCMIAYWPGDRVVIMEWVFWYWSAA